MAEDTGNVAAPIEGSAAVPEANAGTPAGDTLTPKPESWEKIDVNKLTPEELKHYKFFQGHFTKATQKFAEKEKEFSGKLQSYESLLGDELIKPLAYYRTYGRLPDGVDPTAFVTQLNNVLNSNGQTTIPQADPNAPYVDDNVKAYFNNLLQQTVAPLMQKLQMSESFVNKATNEKAMGSINSFKDNLVKEDPKLGELFDKYVSNGQLTEALKQTPVSSDFNKRLEFAFNGLSSKEYVPLVKEKVRQQVLEELNKKNNTPRPESNGTGGTVSQVNKKDLRAILSEEFDKIGQ